MSQIPQNLKYIATHEWVREDADGLVCVGITDYAQEMLGDLVYVELPELGQIVDANEECAVLESVKAASDIYSPLSGEIVAVNEDLSDNPALINESPYEKGWLFKLKLINSSGSLDELLDAAAYAKIIENE